MDLFAGVIGNLPRGSLLRMSFVACSETGSKYAVNISQTTTTTPAYRSAMVNCLPVLVLTTHFTYVQNTVLASGETMCNKKIFTFYADISSTLNIIFYAS